MSLNVGKELAALRRMTTGELQARYAEVFGETTNAHHKEWMIKRIIWRLQSVSQGNLSERARQRAAELANDADIRRKPPKSPKPTPQAETRTITLEYSTPKEARLPLPGSTLVREYKGRKLEVLVLPGGFEFEGTMYKSLSAVAKVITSSHVNGYHFFRLTKKGGDQ